MLYDGPQNPILIIKAPILNPAYAPSSKCSPSTVWAQGPWPQQVLQRRLLVLTAKGVGAPGAVLSGSCRTLGLGLEARAYKELSVLILYGSSRFRVLGFRVWDFGRSAFWGSCRRCCSAVVQGSSEGSEGIPDIIPP